MRVRRLLKSTRWFAFAPMRRWRYLLIKKFRSAAGGMHWSTELEVAGAFDCADSTAFGRRTRLSVLAGGRLIFKRGAWLGDDCEVSATGTISVGVETSLQDRSIILGDVTFGSGCLCGANLYISSAWHHFEDSPALPIRWQDAQAMSGDGKAKRSRAVSIGDDCWIGVNVVVAPGVKIGRGCVIGANSVVTKDLPPYTVAAGAPAKILRERLKFSPPRSLQANKVAHLPYFYSGFVQWRNSAQELEQALVGGGWQVEKEFALAMAIDAGVSFRLQVRSPWACEVWHGSQKSNVQEGESILNFRAELANDGLLAFRWRPYRDADMRQATLVILACNQD